MYSWNTKCREHAKAKELMARLVEGSAPWHLTWQIIFEFLRTATHARVSERTPLYIDEATRIVQGVLSVPSMQLIHPGPRHFEVFSTLAASTAGVRGNLVHDVRMVAIMLENGVKKIYSADTGLRRFKDIEIINPFG